MTFLEFSLLVTVTMWVTLSCACFLANITLRATELQKQEKPEDWQVDQNHAIKEALNFPMSLLIKYTMHRGEDILLIKSKLININKKEKKVS